MTEYFTKKESLIIDLSQEYFENLIFSDKKELPDSLINNEKSLLSFLEFAISVLNDNYRNSNSTSNRKADKSKEAKLKSKLLNFIAHNSDAFLEKVDSKVNKISYCCILLFIFMLKSKDENQRKIAETFVNEKLDVIEKFACDISNSQGLNPDVDELRNIFFKIVSPELKEQTKEWFEKAISNDHFDVRMVSWLKDFYDHSNEDFSDGKNKNGDEKILNFTKIYIEKYGLPIEKTLEKWKISNYKPFEAFCFIKELEDKKPGITKVLSEEFGIYCFWRYPIEVLIDQYDNKNNVNIPYGIMVFSEADKNNVLARSSTFVEGLYKDFKKQEVKKNFHIRIIEVGGKFELARRLLFLHKKYINNKIAFVIGCYHGWSTYTQLGPDPKNDNHWLDIKDLQGRGFKRSSDFFEKEAEFLQISCSTGMQSGLSEEMSKIYYKVTAPDGVITMEGIKISPVFTKNGITFTVESTDSMVNFLKYTNGKKV